MADRHEFIRLYRQMLLIRCFEERVNDLFLKGLVGGTAHLCVGQEAVAVGVCSALRAGDRVTSTHRGHGHFIARGGDPRRIMAELFGKKTGYSGGRGGSQLMALYRIGFLGANGITGGSIPVATGVALSLKRRRLRSVAACFFGDGAANQGVFHESLNMAAIWKLPVVYVCENNLYAMSTPFCRAFAVPDIAGRAAAYGFSGVRVDGNDVLAVRKAALDACRRARAGDGPTLIECRTYRRLGHSRGDPCAYRSREEERAWEKNDPIRRFRLWLKRRGWLNAQADQRWRREARRAVSDAVRFAVRSPDPDPARLEEGVFA
jgi:TPP-dependent pyruvate/acetoin dehydrogenase alpha subunit